MNRRKRKILNKLKKGRKINELDLSYALNNIHSEIDKTKTEENKNNLQRHIEEKTKKFNELNDDINNMIIEGSIYLFSI